MTQTLIEQLEKLPRFSIFKLGISAAMVEQWNGQYVNIEDLLAIIEQAKREAVEPFGYLLAINGELVFRKTITEAESLVYSSMPVYCGNTSLVPSSVMQDALMRSVDVVAPTPQPELARCKSCNGNDYDMPCAYPSEGKHGCLRDAREAIK